MGVKTIMLSHLSFIKIFLKTWQCVFKKKKKKNKFHKNVQETNLSVDIQFVIYRLGWYHVFVCEYHFVSPHGYYEAITKLFLCFLLSVHGLYIATCLRYPVSQ